MVVVSDATPLIALAKIGGLAWLNRLFGEIFIPQAVYHEVVVVGVGKTGSEEVANAAWIPDDCCRESGESRLFALSVGYWRS